MFYNRFFIFFPLAFTFGVYGSNSIESMRSLYLELMKKTLLNTIYEPAGFKEVGTEWPKYAHSMIGKKRMDNIQYCIEEILKNDISGDFIETGVWQGGATIFMRAVLKAYDVNDRIVWAADSFEGLPVPDVQHYPVDASAGFFNTYEFLKVSLEQVQTNFKAYDLLDDQVKFLKGFFKDTMPNCPVKKLALLRLDGDMYESTIEVLESLYDRLSSGGFIIIDDWNLGWARQAVLDFRKDRNITEPIMPIDGSGIYWKKK